MSYDNNFFEDFEDDDTNCWSARRDPFDHSYEEEFNHLQQDDTCDICWDPVQPGVKICYDCKEILDL